MQPLNNSKRKRTVEKHLPKAANDPACLRHIDVLSFAWKSLKDRKNRTYYFSVVTGETVWERPQMYVSRKLREAHIHVRDIRTDLFELVKTCTDRGIEIAVVPPDGRWRDPYYGSNIRGVSPKLTHCLFYEPLLRAGLEIYPSEFLTKSGLKKIVLCGKMHYLKQSRKAIPVNKTGMLYLDPEPEIIYYLQVDC